MFFALLSLMVNAVTVVVAVALVLRRLRTGRALVEFVAPLALPSAFLVSLVATLGSLWFSESAGFVPCKLCWYQRAAVFPLPLLLGSMLLRRDRRAMRHTLALTVPGAVVAVWHWLVERVPALAGSASCALDVPCSVPWFTEFGFITLAWMSLSTSAFVGVAALCVVVSTSSK